MTNPGRWRLGNKMHTDAYEISLAREINVCIRVIKQTKEKLIERKQRIGMDLPQAGLAVAEGRLALTDHELADWKDDFEALPQWEQRLEQYRQALAAMRISASRF
jgi:hypothetical protein